MKINKREIVEVEGIDWKIEVKISTEDFDSLDDIFIESSTRAVESIYKQNPSSFKVGAIIRVNLQRMPSVTKYCNSYKILCNASIFKAAEMIKKNYLSKKKNDLSKMDMFIAVTQ